MKEFVELLANRLQNILCEVLMDTEKKENLIITTGELVGRLRGSDQLRPMNLIWIMPT